MINAPPRPPDLDPISAPNPNVFVFLVLMFGFFFLVALLLAFLEWLFKGRKKDELRI